MNRDFITFQSITPAQQAQRILLRAGMDGLLQRTPRALAQAGCGYCLRNCPQKIFISRYFKLYNESAQKPSQAWKLKPAYEAAARNRGRASDCIGCGVCEKNCPQMLPIREYLAKVKEVLE